MSIAIKRIKRAIAGMPTGGMQTGKKHIKLEYSDAQRAIAEIEALTAERDALAAQVEALRKSASDAYTQWNYSNDVYGAMQHLIKAVIATPQQHLRDVRAEAVIDAINNGFTPEQFHALKKSRDGIDLQADAAIKGWWACWEWVDSDDRDKPTLIPAADQYADSIRNAKHGEFYVFDADGNASVTIGDTPEQLGTIAAADAIMIDGKIVARQQIIELTAERDALAAQVDVLRTAALGAISFMSGGKAKAALRDAYDATPQQHLAELQAEAGRAGFIAGARAMRSHGPSNIIREADEYSDQILAQDECALEYTENQAENEDLDHFVDVNKMVLDQYTVYEWREIGETNWQVCDKKWFHHCRLSPELDTRMRLIRFDEIKKQAFKQGFEACINAAVKIGMIDSDGEFANQLRQQAKDGK